MAYRVFAPSSLSKVFCRFSSSISVTVTSRSRSVEELIEMGGVTPRYLLVATYSIPHSFSCAYHSYVLLLWNGHPCWIGVGVEKWGGMNMWWWVMKESSQLRKALP